MSTNALSDRPDPGSLPDGWRSRRETAPSVTRAADPTLARWGGLAGLFIATLGLVSLLAIARGRAPHIGTIEIGPFWSSFLLMTGLAFMLLHAALDADESFRRLYGALGYGLLALGIVLTVIPVDGRAGALFLPYSFFLMVLALLFLLAYARNEIEPGWHRTAVRVLGLVGAATALTGFVGGSIAEAFLLGADGRPPYAVFLILLGLLYLWGFLGLRGTGNPLGYRVAVAMAGVGAIVVLVAFVRSALPLLYSPLHWVRTRPEPYFVPAGLTLIVSGLVYFGVAVSLASDNRFIVLFRRELSAFFYSPIAYIVLFAFVMMAWVMYWMFIYSLARQELGGAPLWEPVISNYLLQWQPVICLIVAVPVLTMRLLAEEKRTGTLEVLLTSPVGETSVVLSKFLAVLVFYMLTWLPWAVCLVFFRTEGGQPFEYRPLLIFYLMIGCTGAGFLSIGMFFSSITRNQIAAAILSFMTILGLLILYFVLTLTVRQGGDAASGWVPLLRHISFLNLWIEALYESQVTPAHYVFYPSVAVFFLFLTIKVLEARKCR